MMRLVLAPKSMKGIKEKLLQTHGWKIKQKYSKNHEKEKWSIKFGDKIHAQRSAISRESNIYKMWKLSQHPLTLWRIGGIPHFLSSPLLSSPLLSYTMKHIDTSQKETMAMGWEMNDWVLTSPPALGVLIIGKLITKHPLWSNIMKTKKLG
jgi:hypothetical protein